MSIKKILLGLALFANLSSISTEPVVSDIDMLDYFDRVLKTPEFLFSKISRDIRYPAALIRAEDFLHIMRATVDSYLDKGLGPHVVADNSNWLPDHGGKPTFESRSMIDGSCGEINGYIQKLMLPVGAQVIAFGDLHGSPHALARMLCELMRTGYLDQQLRLIKPNTYMIFLGDFTDYGFDGVGTLNIAFHLRAANPNNVFLCRGNHEDRCLNEHPRFDFAGEVLSKYGPAQAKIVLKEVYDLYEYLPFAIFLGIKGSPDAGYAQCCHGGIEQGAIETIRQLLNNQQASFAKLPKTAFVKGYSGLNWSDVTGYDHVPLHAPSDRGVGVCSSIDGVQEYMDDLNINLFLRGHQDCNNCFKMLMRGVQEPVYFFKQEKEIADEMKPLRKEIGQLVEDSDALYETGFRLGDLPKNANGKWTIAPFITATNASAAKGLDDEGFCIITLGKTWQDSNVRAYVATNELMEYRHLITSNKSYNCVTRSELASVQQILGYCAPSFNKMHIDEEEYLKILEVIYNLPHMSYVDEQGISKHAPVLTDDCMQALLIKHAKRSDLVRYFKSQHVLPALPAMGITQGFKDLVRGRK